MQRRKRDEVGILFARLRRVGYGQQSMSNLLDIDRLGEGSLLGVETLKVHTRLVVGYAVGRCGRMVAMTCVRASFHDNCRP